MCAEGLFESGRGYMGTGGTMCADGTFESSEGYSKSVKCSQGYLGILGLKSTKEYQGYYKKFY